MRKSYKRGVCKGTDCTTPKDANDEVEIRNLTNWLCMYVLICVLFIVCLVAVLPERSMVLSNER